MKIFEHDGPLVHMQPRVFFAHRRVIEDDMTSWTSADQETILDADELGGQAWTMHGKRRLPRFSFLHRSASIRAWPAGCVGECAGCERGERDHKEQRDPADGEGRGTIRTVRSA